jgi:hypothetical protein
VTGVLAYIAFVMILTVWCLGWLGISAFIGSLLDVPTKVSVASGVILGPLGVLFVLLSGVIQKRNTQTAGRSTTTSVGSVPFPGDPFA